jgi:hypothetical protein
VEILVQFRYQGLDRNDHHDNDNNDREVANSFRVAISMADRAKNLTYPHSSGEPISRRVP